MASNGYKSKQRIVSASVRNPNDGRVVNFTARTKSGGDKIGNTQKEFLGGMTPSVPIGGGFDGEREDATLTITYSDAVRAELRWLDQGVSLYEVSITEQLGGVGGTDTTSGILDQVKTPEYDASSTELQELELVVVMGASMA